MPMNAVYSGPADLPEVLSVFPLPGALLLPRGQMPLNIFEARYLQLVDDALARIKDGTFGECVSCHEELQQKRLEAVPWARHCIACQEKMERGQL